MLQHREIPKHPPDYLVHQSRTTSVYCATIIMFVLAAFFVSLRFYVRSRISHFRGKDDYWILAALFATAVDLSIQLSLLQYGYGRHVWNVAQYEKQKNAELTFAIQILYTFPLGLVKISILTFYLRLFPYETFRKVCHGTRIFVGAMTIAFSFAMIFACTPIRDGWSWAPGNHCVNKAGIQYSFCSLNLATDLFILFLPSKYLWALPINKKEKIGVIILFSLGLIACIASAFRITTIAMFYRDDDPTWAGARVTICSALEGNLAIITSSIPACRPVFRDFGNKFLPKRFFPNSRANKEASKQTAMPENWRPSSRCNITDSPEFATSHDTDGDLVDDHNRRKESLV